MCCLEVYCTCAIYFLQMLKYPLVGHRSIKAYLSEEYGYTKQVSAFLLKHKFLKEVIVKQHFGRTPHVLYHDTRANPGRITPWDVALSLHPHSYLTGYTALSMLGWTEYAPRKIYVNWVRGIREKPILVAEPINQEVLQRVAFQPKKAPPVSLTFDGDDIVILSGQFFSSAEKHHLVRCPSRPDLPKYAMTLRAERLFLEALVNYHYFGGPEIVWQALLSKARDIAQESLLKTYAEMRLKYPYANAIAYILECSLRKTARLDKWLPLVNRELRFHLFMGDGERRVYVEKWSLYVPKRFYVAGG